MGVALLLGLLQGLTEWLPVSSQGVVTVAQTALLDRTLSEAVAYALWLHAGTACAALVALRREAWGVVRDAIAAPLSPSPQLRFLVIGAVVSAVVGIPTFARAWRGVGPARSGGDGRRGRADDRHGRVAALASG